MKEVLTVILTIIIFSGTLSIFYILFYNNLQAYKVRVNEAESIIDELLRKKYDTINNIKNLIINLTNIKEKIFNDFNKIKKLNISSFDLERKLKDFNNLIDKIISDYKELKENEDLNFLLEDLYQLNEKLEATKIFYNKYTNYLNKSIKKFPSNIIAKIHHIEINSFFDGKDFNDNLKNDFKI